MRKRAVYLSGNVATGIRKRMTDLELKSCSSQAGRCRNNEDGNDIGICRMNAGVQCHRA